MKYEFWTGDILLVRSHGWVGKAIRSMTRNRREGETMVNHAGIFVSSKTVVEALTTGVIERPIEDMLRAYQHDEIAVYRPCNVPGIVLDEMARRARMDVGRPYGYLKIATHALDWCLGGVYLFRRLTQADRYPICSWVVAKAYDAIGLDFGVPAGAATPDDIWDFVTRERMKYQEVLPLSKPEAQP